MPKQYPDEIKKQVVLSYQNGILIPNLSRRSQISQSTLCRWMNEVFSIKIFIENYAAQRDYGRRFHNRWKGYLSLQPGSQAHRLHTPCNRGLGDTLQYATHHLLGTSHFLISASKSLRSM